VLRRERRTGHHCARARALLEWCVGICIGHLRPGEVAIETRRGLHRGKSWRAHRVGRDGHIGGAFADALRCAIPRRHGNALARIPVATTDRVRAAHAGGFSIAASGRCLRGGLQESVTFHDRVCPLRRGDAERLAAAHEVRVGTHLFDIRFRARRSAWHIGTKQTDR
jgi:hypothetical protein